MLGQYKFDLQTFEKSCARTMDPVYIEPAQLCRAFFVLASGAALGANAIPSLRQWFISYGARSIRASPARATSRIENSSKSTIFLALAAQLQVPHSWFTHYYITSISLSIFWAYQLLMSGIVFRFLASVSTSDTQASMTINQVLLVWLMMMLQGCRRFYECITLLKPSASKMHISSWVLGIAFYVIVSVSVWVEGIRES
jgi:3-oxo-5-alpha-steroid 4-dehydrogenase 3 / polyprenol reductase